MNKINKIVCLSKSPLRSRAGKRIVPTSSSYLLNSAAIEISKANSVKKFPNFLNCLLNTLKSFQFFLTVWFVSEKVSNLFFPNFFWCWFSSSKSFQSFSIVWFVSEKVSSFF